MDRQAIDVHGRIAFSNANCALPKTGQKRRWRKVRFWHIAARDVCDGTSAVGESGHRIPGAHRERPNEAAPAHRGENGAAYGGCAEVTAPRLVICAESACATAWRPGPLARQESHPRTRRDGSA
jgi:hypothetical protein